MLGFPSCTARPIWMRGLLHIYDGVKAFHARSATPSRSSLWCVMTRPPLLQSNMWHIDSAPLKQSKWGERYWGSMPYHWNKALHHSWSQILVPFNADGNTVIYTPFLVPHLSQWSFRSGVVVTASSSAAYSFCTLRHRISPLTYCRSRAWYPVLNSTFPQISGTRSPVMTQEVVQFSKADRVGFGISSPECLIGR